MAETVLPFSPTIAKAREALSKVDPLELQFDSGFGDHTEFPEVYKACLKDPKQVLLRARMILSGHGNGAEQKEALPLFREASRQEEGRACSFLATLYFDGLLVPADFDRAQQFAEKGVKLGEPSAYDVLIELATFGLDEAYSEKRMTELEDAKHKLILELYRENQYRGWLQLIRESAHGPKRYRDLERALSLAKPLAEAGSLIAQNVHVLRGGALQANRVICASTSPVILISRGGVSRGFGSRAPRGPISQQRLRKRSNVADDIPVLFEMSVSFMAGPSGLSSDNKRARARLNLTDL